MSSTLRVQKENAPNDKTVVEKNIILCLPFAFQMQKIQKALQNPS